MEGETVWSCLYDCISNHSSYSKASSPRQPSAPWVQSLLWAIEQALFDKIWKGFIHAGEQRERLVKTWPSRDCRPIRRLQCVSWEDPIQARRLWSWWDITLLCLCNCRGSSRRMNHNTWHFFMIKPIIFCVPHNLMDVCLLTFFL